jgi:hypothetical protein
VTATKEKKNKKDKSKKLRKKSFDAAVEKATGKKPKKIKSPKPKKPDPEYRGIRYCSKKFQAAVDAVIAIIATLTGTGAETQITLVGTQYTAKTKKSKPRTGFYLAELSFFTPNGHGGGGGCSYMRSEPEHIGLLARIEDYLSEFFTKPDKYGPGEDQIIDYKQEAEDRLQWEWRQPSGHELASISLRLRDLAAHYPTLTLKDALAASLHPQYGESIHDTLVEEIATVPKEAQDRILVRFHDDHGMPHKDPPKDHKRDMSREEAARLVNENTIDAEVHSDDHNVAVKFDAVDWFRYAQEPDLLKLHAANWGGDYAADAVAEHFNCDGHEVKKLFDYLDIIKDDPSKKDVNGFECHVNGEHAMWWLRDHRKDMYDKIMAAENGPIETGDVTVFNIPVRFDGSVRVNVPSDVPTGQQRPLAERYALARVLATTDNPDAPEEDACDEYRDSFNLDDKVAGEHWDASSTDGVSGSWKLSL